MTRFFVRTALEFAIFAIGVAGILGILAALLTGQDYHPTAVGAAVVYMVSKPILNWVRR